MNKELATNTTLSHYRILSKIGAGGMGEVYLAQDTKLDRKVALKILPAEVVSHRGRMERFIREAKSAAALNHPNIAHVYEIGESNGTHFIAMEFIDGETLREKIHRDKAPLPKLLKYLIQVAQGLSKAHAAGIVHRDLKPENIMITRDDYAKVLDFGLAKLVEPQRTFGSNESGSSEIATAVMQQPGPPAGQYSSSAQHSTTGMVIGTIGYMSPEQASGRVDEIDHRSDIFSFGCILFEAATGQRAFEGKDVLDSLHKIVHAPTPQLKDVNPLAPAELQRVVRRCLAKEPEKRYQSIKELAIELDDLQQELKGFIESEYSGHSDQSTSVTTSGTTRMDEGFWVAVLPFQARDADPAVAALADGLSEEIVTGLSRFRYLSVVSSASAARLKGKTEAERAQLGTRYVLEGSVRKGGSAIRVSAQLVDTETGAQLWSETYNRDLQTSNIFAVQDDVAGRIVATVADSYGVLVHSMRAATRQKNDADLMPVEWQFQYFAYREQITPSAHAALKSRLERVVKRNDRQSDMWACIAQIYVDEYAFGFQDDATSLDRALAAGRRAVELDRANQFALVALAQVHFFRQDLAAFGPAAERAMALNPLNTDALGILGLQIVHTGEFERGTAIVRHAMELNPNHAGWMHFAPLWDHFHKGEYEQALECANRVDVPGLFWPFLVMASACGHLGRRSEAEAAVRDLLTLDPEFAAHARSNVGTWHFASGLMDPILEGLRKAGLEISDEKEAAVSAPELARSPAADSGAARAQEGFWVAVLPFKCGGTSLEIKSLAEGLSEDIITGLSRFFYLRVIAHGPAVRVATESGDVREIGKALGARYVMEGSLRQAGTKLRLAVQLVDATNGAHLWAETYERSFSPDAVFELQDDLVPRIVSTVADHYGALVHSMSESLRGRSAGQYSAHEAVLRAFGYLERITPEEHAEVREILETAVARAPGHSDCQAMLSLIYWHEYANGFNVRPDPLGRAHAAARQAVAAAPTNHLAHYVLATVLFYQKDFLAFRPAAERALALNQMDASTTAFLGILIAYTGDWEYGLGVTERAKQLNPHHAGWYHFPAFHYAYHRRDYRGALEIALKINMPGYFFTQAALAAVYGQLGEQERARVALRELHALVPNFGALAREEYGKWFDAELTEHLIDGLRKAGLEIADKGEERSALNLQDVRSAIEDKLKLELSTPSIAILPFVNISNDPDNDYFCEGLAEELLNALTKIDHLKVAARTSAFSFKGKNTTVGEIGQRLSVNTVMEGSVRRSGNRLRITVQLVNASDGYHLWSERYDREMQDIFDVQDEITLAVVDALKLKLFSDEKAAVLKRYTDDVEAHELFLKGRYYAYKYTAEGWKRAIEFFKKAIEKQPDYAPAYAGIASSCGCLWFFGFLPAGQTILRSKTATVRALEIDENLADAHLSSAIIIFFYDWEWEKAEQQFKQSIALNPNNAEALTYYALFLAFEERYDEAISGARRALEIDPLSPLINMNVGWAYFSAGLSNEALDQANKMSEIEPDFYGAYWLKGAIRLSEGAYEEAVEELKKAVSLGGRQIVLADLASAYALAGKNDEAAAILDQLLEMRQREYVPAICMARIYSRIGENDKAVEWLEKAFEERNGEMVFLKSEIAGAADGDSLNSLGSDPRLIELLRKMRLPQQTM